MKKKLLIVVVILSMLMAFTGTAFAAGSAVELLSAQAGLSGTVFIFHVSGEFSGAELQGMVHVENGPDFSLDCRQLDDETVRCVTSFKVQGDVAVTFGGSTFWTYVRPYTRAFIVPTTGSTDPTDPPVDPPVDPVDYCYTIYDWPPQSEPATEWTNIGTNCQPDEAVDGQVITYYNPGWNGTFDYTFRLDSPDPCGAVFPPLSDDAYYYDDGGC